VCRSRAGRADRGFSRNLDRHLRLATDTTVSAVRFVLFDAAAMAAFETAIAN